MRIFYGGGEAPTLRRRLKEAGAQRFSVSFWHLRDRLPKSGRFPFDERFPEGTEILLDAGAYTANKRREEHDDDFFVDYLNEYIDLVGANIDRLTLVTEFDFVDYSVEDLWALRFEVWNQLPAEKFLPVWHAEHGFEELVKLARAYPRVAIPGADLEDVAHRLPSVSNRHGCRFHGLAANKQALIERAALWSASSSSWVSATRYGERLIFDGQKLHRYGKEDRDDAIRSHATMLEKAGFEIEELLAQEPEALTRLAVWSFDSWAEFLTRKMGVSRTSEVQSDATPAQAPPEQPAPSPEDTRNAIVPRTPDEMKVLPILSVSKGTHRTVDDDGHVHEVKTEEQLSSRGDSVRQCDSCYLANICPEFRAGDGCAYSIPVSIRSKEQLVAAMTALLEMQGQRAMFARFAEELEGGYPSKAVSSEFDRFFALTEKMKDIQDNRDFLRISVEGKAHGGVLSRIFGEQAGNRARELENPMDRQQTNELLAQVVEDAEIVD